MYKRLLIYLLVMLAWTDASIAQTGVTRLEFPAELEKNPYQVISLEKEGLLMFYAQAEMIGDNDRSWHFTLYDTNLFLQWETEVPVLNGARYRGYHVEDSSLYLLFFNPDKIKGNQDNYQVSVLGMTTGIIDHYTGYLHELSEVKGFLVSSGKVLLAGDLESEQAALYILDLQRQSRREYITILPDQNFVEDLQIDPYTGTALMVTSNFISRKQNRILLLQIDLNGELIKTFPVEVVLPSKYLNAARVIAFSPNNYVLTGNYSNFASKIPGPNDYYGLEAAGFFMTRFEDGEQQYMKYYNLLELQNLRPAISARDYLKLAKKKNRNETEYSADYEMILGPIERYNDQVLLMAEAFYPDFRTVSDISYDYWGRPITHTYTVFEGYRIFQGLLLAFNVEGDLLYDNSIELNNINTMELTNRSGYFFEGKPVVLYYNDGNKITMRAFAGNALIEEAVFTELDTSYRGDKVIELGNNYMKPWFDNYFICYGYHTIRNNLVAEKEKRTVFYINKVIFE